MRHIVFALLAVSGLQVSEASKEYTVAVFGDQKVSCFRPPQVLTGWKVQGIRVELQDHFSAGISVSTLLCFGPSGLSSRGVSAFPPGPAKEEDGWR
jgi:hypothetical protein